MNWLQKLRLRANALFHRRELDADMDDEMRSHIELGVQQNIEAGMPPDEARHAARRQFGWTESIKETCRDQRGVDWLENLGQDIRYGARQLRKNPGFTAVAVLTLALGIGATTAIFSLVNAVLLRDLPFAHSDRLAVVWADNPGLRFGTTQIPPANADVAAWRERHQTFEAVAAFSPRTADIADGLDPEQVGAAGITAGFFETLGVTPLLGRTLAPGEEVPGGPPVVLIGHGLWQRRFGGDPALLGKSISINGEKRTVIGILPAEFDFPRGAEWPALFPFAGRTEAWLPLAFRAQDDGTGYSNWQSRHERGLVVIGRMKPGVTLRQAQAEMDTFSAREAHDHSDTHKGWTLKLITLRQQLAGKSRKPLLILSAAAGLLLVIACVNVANLLLARGVGRRQELAVRAALGAGRGRLVRQLLTEGLLLAGMGSALGLLVGYGCLRAFLAMNAATHSRLDEASLDLAVLGFMALTTLVTSVVFGLAPAINSSRLDLRGALHEGGRGADGAVRERVRGWLVSAEVALALVLLTTAGLMVRSFIRVQGVHPGFRSDSVLAFDLQLPNARYATEPSQAAFYEQLLARMEALPGVRAAGAISYLPLGGGENMGSFIVEGEPPVDPGNEPSAERRIVTPGYFATMGIALLKGRVFTSRDTADQPKVVVINETIARQFFNSREPVGQRLKVGGASRTIVGVVSDVKSASLESKVRPQTYMPIAQWAWAGMTVVLHAERPPLALVSAVRSELKAMDGQLPAAKIRTMERVVSNATSARRFSLALLVFFAVAALLLTMMGIYGVVAFLVGRRHREIGIRMALGAQRRDVLRLVLQQGMKPVVFGSLFGLAGAFAASRLVASQLYGILPSDPLTLASIMAVLAGAALLACWIPARRAVRADPMVALRTE